MLKSLVGNSIHSFKQVGFIFLEFHIQSASCWLYAGAPVLHLLILSESIRLFIYFHYMAYITQTCIVSIEIILEIQSSVFNNQHYQQPKKSHRKPTLLDKLHSTSISIAKAKRNIGLKHYSLNLMEQKAKRRTTNNLS